MQRIALCYGIVSLFALFCNHKYTLHTIIGLLVVYTAIIVLGNGYEYDADVNILAQADLKLFGYDHIYHKSPVDPEGLMGTISSVAHVLLGFYCGMMIRKRETIEQKVIALFVVGAICVIGGYLLSYGLPPNKRIWSPSYVLMTCGLASLLQALLMYVIDIQKNSGWTTFFHVFGVNALALYVSSELLAILLKNIGVSEVIYNGIHAVVPALKWASLAYAIYFVLLNFAIGYVLYRKKIYIKL
jgi:predicted acyltransferase